MQTLEWCQSHKGKAGEGHVEGRHVVMESHVARVLDQSVRLCRCVAELEKGGLRGGMMVVRVRLTGA